MAALNCINLSALASFPCSFLIGREVGEAPPNQSAAGTDGRNPTAYHCPLNRHHNGCGLSPMWAVEKGRNLQYFLDVYLSRYVDIILSFFDHLPSYTWTFFAVNVDKNRHF